MNKTVLILATITAFAPCVPLISNAATQVYDLKADWSDTANPNGAWSYREGDSLLINNPFPWVGTNYPTPPLGNPTIPFVTRTTEGTVLPGYLDLGDVFANPGNGGNILWTAPANGTISVSGALWPVDVYSGGFGTSWTLKHNGNLLSSGDVPCFYCGPYDRSSPTVLTSGSGGAEVLQNITVAAGDLVVLGFGGRFDGVQWRPGEKIGCNLTVTFAPASVDPISAIEALATTVVQMNLQNGIENSLDSKLDAALDVLVDVNLKNDGAACNSVAAFVSAVEAQRNKKITSAQADGLIAAAQQIQAMLNCGN